MHTKYTNHKQRHTYVEAMPF